MEKTMNYEKPQIVKGQQLNQVAGRLIATLFAEE